MEGGFAITTEDFHSTRYLNVMSVSNSSLKGNINSFIVLDVDRNKHAALQLYPNN
jgi:hypothetical protein